MKFSATHAMIAPETILSHAKNLEPYREQLAAVATTNGYTTPESSIRLAFDDELLTDVQALANQLRRPTLQYIVVIGIGGSNLGTQAIYEAIAGSMNLLVDRLPKLLFLDTVSDERMTAISRELTQMPSTDDFCVITISKSGGTTETIANLEALWSRLDQHFGAITDRLAVITGEGSKLWKAAASNNIAKISIPEHVGGRYSVFSAVGLLPLELANIDVNALRDGAREAVADATSNDIERNIAMASAIMNFEHDQGTRHIHNTFLFTPKLETLGKWYRQLMGESTGKDGKGMTPIVSIGSTDLHSMAQLYFGGPDDKFTNLLYTFKGDINLVPTQLKLPSLVDNIGGKSLEEIMQAILGGVKEAYKKTHRPFIEIDLEGTSAHELGYYLQFRMIEMMYLGKLMNVNTFNQPEVELYKETTRDLLKH